MTSVEAQKPSQKKKDKKKEEKKKEEKKTQHNSPKQSNGPNVQTRFSNANSPNSGS